MFDSLRENPPQKKPQNMQCSSINFEGNQQTVCIVFKIVFALTILN